MKSRNEYKNEVHFMDCMRYHTYSSLNQSLKFFGNETPSRNSGFRVFVFSDGISEKQRKMINSQNRVNMDDLDSYLVERGIKLSSEQKNKIVAWLNSNAWKSLQSVPRNKYYGLFMK